MIAPEKVRARAAEKKMRTWHFAVISKTMPMKMSWMRIFKNGMWRFLSILIVASVEIAARCTVGAFRGKTLLEMQRIWA